MFDDDFIQQDGKYRGYAAGMDKALKNFEYSSEWPDLISALGKLNKVISSHSKYKVIPRRLLLSKRLSQCLHPSLPSGVHLKALETYDLIFKCMGSEKLASELFIYAAGLFPLLNYAAMSVRPNLLNIYETHLLALGDKLVPCLDGFLPAVLLGMEESSDYYQRTTNLLDSVKQSVGVGKFYTTLWRCVHSVPSARQPAITYLLGNKEDIVGEDLEQVLTSIQLCLVDSNILVQRASLELLATRDFGKGLDLVKAALRTLLRRDTSLNRRLYTWLSGSEDELIYAIQSLLCDDDEDNFRILVYLFDKSEVCDLILDRVLVDVIRSLYIHSGVILRSANLFFTTLHPNYVWDHLFKELSKAVESNLISRVQKPGSGPASLPELSILLSFLVDLDSSLDKSYLVHINSNLSQLILEKLDDLSSSASNLHSLLTLLACFESQCWPSFHQIYVKFVCGNLFREGIEADVCYDLLVTKEVDLYDEDFEVKLTQSLESMCEKEEVYIPPLNCNPEAYDCLKILNNILAKYKKCEEEKDNDLSPSSNSNTSSEMVLSTRCLLITATMADCETIRLNAIDTVISLLEFIHGSGVLVSTVCVQSIADYLWSRMPVSKSGILQLYKYFPGCVERTLSVRVAEGKYANVIQLLRQGHDMKLENNFDTLVLKCLENLESKDALAKTSSERFVFEFLSSVGVVVDPLLRILEENFTVMESVLTFEEKEKTTRVVPSISIGRFEGADKSPRSSREDLELGIRGPTPKVLDLSGEEESVVDSSQLLRRKTQLFVDDSGRIHTKAESDEEFDELEVSQSQSQGCPAGDSLSAAATATLSEDEDPQTMESDVEDMQPTRNESEEERSSNYYFDTPYREMDGEVDEHMDSISANVSEERSPPNSSDDVDMEAEVKLVLDKLDLDLEESLGGVGIDDTFTESLEVEPPEPGVETEHEAPAESTLTLPETENENLTSSFSAGQSNGNTNTNTPLPTIEEPLVLVGASKKKLFSIHPYNTQLQIYTKKSDHPRVLYALTLVKQVINTNSRAFLISISTTVSNSRVTYLEVLLSYLLKLTQGFYNEEPNPANVSIHIEGIRLIGSILTGLLDLINSKGFSNFIGDMFAKIRLQKTILYTLCSLVMMKSDEELTSTERILKLNYDGEFDIVYNEIVRVITSIIAIEAETFQHQKAKVPPSNKYITNVPFCKQPLYLEALLKTLTNTGLCTCHKAALNSVTNSLPFYATETGRIVSKVVECVCGTLKGWNEDSMYVGRILEALTSITHYVLLEQNAVEKVEQQASSHILYSLVSVFLPVVGGSREKDSTSPTNQPQASPAKVELLTLLPHLVSTILTIWNPNIKLKILDLINPIAFNHVHAFINSIGRQQDQIPTCVELVSAMKVIILENLVSGIISCVKASDDEAHQITLLNFLSAYIDKSKILTEIWHLLIGLVKDGPTLPAKCQLIVFEICYKLAVSGIPTVKADLKELQEGSYKLIESVSSSSSTEKKYRNDITLQLDVLQCLGSYFGPLVDLVWGSEDKVSTLVAGVVYNVFQHVKSRYPQTHYLKSINFFASLSSYSYLRKSWKKEIFEALVDQNFFLFGKECIPPWRIILDNLFTLDKYTFAELLNRVSVPQTGSLNIFTSKEIEYESRAMLLKRLAFVIFCSKKDQYVRFITVIQERLAEAIKVPQMIPGIHAQVFLCFRVLLLRLSPQHLNALWPIMLHEILQVLIQMETDILTRNPNWLNLYLQLCKLLELALNLPPSQLPMFQMYRWAFTGQSTFSFTPHLTRLAEQLEETKSTNGVKALRSNKIESLGELHDFLKNSEGSKAELSVFEAVLENDFLE